MSLAVVGNTILAGTWVDTVVYLSNDSGATWTKSAANAQCTMRFLVVPGTNPVKVLAATYGGGIFASTDTGKTWTPADSGLGRPHADPQTWVIDFAIHGNFIFAATLDGMFRSSDKGVSWTGVNIGIPAWSQLRCLYVYGDKIFAGSDNYTDYESTDDGDDWSTVDTSRGLANGRVVKGFTSVGSHLFAGSNGSGVFASTDSGATWTAVNNGIPIGWEDVFCVWTNGTTVYAGTVLFIYQTTDYGKTWTMVDTTGWNGSSQVECSVNCGKYVLVGTLGGILRRQMSQVYTAVDSKSAVEIPKDYSLEQNYPNPFNPSTTITYKLPVASPVTMKLYDALGRLVGTLVDERQNAGDHSVKFDGSNLPSGVYFCRLEAGVFHDTKKLLLLK
ncbi:MAG TPA: T9SS type A sorting domain-containing protein [Candidatus Acidoferrales bacterium]|nr:T9SS type A sorting domain-containing protein [Candidatus Acidoferrales bacterium]